MGSLNPEVKESSHVLFGLYCSLSQFCKVNRSCCSGGCSLCSGLFSTSNLLLFPSHALEKRLRLVAKEEACFMVCDEEDFLYHTLLVAFSFFFGLPQQIELVLICTSI